VTFSVVFGKAKTLHNFSCRRRPIKDSCVQTIKRVPSATDTVSCYGEAENSSVLYLTPCNYPEHLVHD
jgi:hypothetical protein